MLSSCEGSTPLLSVVRGELIIANNIRCVYWCSTAFGRKRDLDRDWMVGPRVWGFTFCSQRTVARITTRKRNEIMTDSSWTTPRHNETRRSPEESIETATWLWAVRVAACSRNSAKIGYTMHDGGGGGGGGRMWIRWGGGRGHKPNAHGTLLMVRRFFPSNFLNPSNHRLLSCPRGSWQRGVRW